MWQSQKYDITIQSGRRDICSVYIFLSHIYNGPTIPQ
jgi:hypothetical protein